MVERPRASDPFADWWKPAVGLGPGLIVLIVCIVAFFVFQEAQGRWSVVGDYNARWDLITSGEPWRIFTGSLLNYRGIPHLLTNVTLILVFGRQVERRFGGVVILLVFFVGGAAAWLSMFAVSPGSQGSGSSSGMTALLGAGAWIALRGSPVTNRATRLYGLSTLISIVIILVVDPTSWGLGGHGGGFVAGLILGAALDQLVPEKPAGRDHTAGQR